MFNHRQYTEQRQHLETRAGHSVLGFAKSAAASLAIGYFAAKSSTPETVKTADDAMLGLLALNGLYYLVRGGMSLEGINKLERQKQQYIDQLEGKNPAE